MSKSRTDHMEEQLTTLIHDMGEMKITLELIRDKQGSHIKRFDSIKESLQQHRESLKEVLSKLEKRLHALEDFMLASLQRLSILKGILWKATPALIAVCALFFSIGIFVDDAEKTVIDVKHTLDKKA